MSERGKIIEYWKKRAKECLDDAKLLLENKRLHSSKTIYRLGISLEC